MLSGIMYAFNRIISVACSRRNTGVIVGVFGGVLSLVLTGIVVAVIMVRQLSQVLDDDVIVIA